MAQATEIDLTNSRAIEQGATYDELTLTWTDEAGVPINITGYTAGGIAFTRNSTDFDVLTQDDATDRAYIRLRNIVWTASGGN